MRLLLDENMSDRRLTGRLRAQGHDPILATEVGLISATDARVLGWAIAQAPRTPSTLPTVALGFAASTARRHGISDKKWRLSR